MPRPANCKRCGRCHVGSLMFASRGFMVLFVSDMEMIWTEEEIWFRDRNQLPIHKRRSNSLSEFLGAANAI